ncbi:AraC family transcriptional regulator [Salidesulfovibrio onnuriiensis]|uniref:AraC family transcriptional regulator n=1 Tax=Salidesulfovibrio onnuriiensis TaxID=2583823 RepID=UPI00165033AC|nr:AraC family transcriptional regulator [Salidesulfovibrio onnuriiensis]
MTKPTTDNPQLIGEYRARINRVMDHVEANIGGGFSLEGLAGVAGFSKFHFNRIFHSVTGESLFSFIQRVRTEKAACMLLNNRRTPITDIAYDCGFSSSAAFSRSFRNRFGMSATQWRATERELTDVGAGRGSMENAGREYSVEPESVEIRTFDSKTLLYVRHTGPYKGDADLFIRLYDRLFTWAAPRGLADVRASETYVLYHDSIEITSGDRLRVSVCIEVPENTRPGGPTGILSFAGGRYLCARFRLGVTEYAEAWRWVFNRYFPSSGYQPDDGYSFEHYPVHDCTSCEGRTLVHICVPVRPL